MAVRGALGDGKASIWAEWLSPKAKDVEVLATWSDPGGWLDGKAAAVTRRVGKGRITYLGGWFDEAMLARVTAKFLGEAKIAPVVPGAHPDVEVSERDGGGKRLLVLINHGGEAHDVALPAGAVKVAGQLDATRLPAHGVAVVKLP